MVAKLQDGQSRQIERVLARADSDRGDGGGGGHDDDDDVDDGGGDFRFPFKDAPTNRYQTRPRSREDVGIATGFPTANNRRLSLFLKGVST